MPYISYKICSDWDVLKSLFIPYETYSNSQAVPQARETEIQREGAIFWYKWQSWWPHNPHGIQSLADSTEVHERNRATGSGTLKLPAQEQD